MAGRLFVVTGGSDDRADLPSIGDNAMNSTKRKSYSIAAMGLMTVFLGSTVAEAGLTGTDRARPGRGFHNRSSSSSSRFTRPTYSPSRSYAAPRAVRSSPQYAVPSTRSRPINRMSAPAIVHQPSVTPRVIYHQPMPQGAIVVQPQRQIRMNECYVVPGSERIISTRVVSTPAPTKEPVVTPGVETQTQTVGEESKPTSP